MCQFLTLQSGMSENLRTQSPVAFAISSPTFLGERPRGPILGARADDAPTSPPVALRWLHICQRALKNLSIFLHVLLFVHPIVSISSMYSSANLESLMRLYSHDLDLIGVELGSCESNISYGSNVRASRKPTHLDLMAD
jgi:hypothetical protein